MSVADNVGSGLDLPIYEFTAYFARKTSLTRIPRMEWCFREPVAGFCCKSRPCLGQSLATAGGQCKNLVQLAIGKQSDIGGDGNREIEESVGGLNRASAPRS